MLPYLDLKLSKKLKKNGIVKTGLNLDTNFVLLGKLRKQNTVGSKEKLVQRIFNFDTFKDVSLRTGSKECQAIKVKLVRRGFSKCIIIFTVEKKNVLVGDKLSGRHGNKGIIAKIVNCADMPITQDGQPIDIIMNPLGIPSRMNLGQVFESGLGFAAHAMKETYEVKNFYKRLGPNSSTEIIYNRLFHASKKTGKSWIFNPNNPGKSFLFSGKTGLKYRQPVSIGYSYIIKLIHLVEDKINSRMIGPYSLLTQQPLKGKSKNGGQRLGEMEVWALEAYGVAYLLQELLTVKSDAVESRAETLLHLIDGNSLPKPEMPKTTKIFIIELQSLCLNISINKGGAFERY